MPARNHSDSAASNRCFNPPQNNRLIFFGTSNRNSLRIITQIYSKPIIRQLFLYTFNTKRNTTPNISSESSRFFIVTKKSQMPGAQNPTDRTYSLPLSENPSRFWRIEMHFPSFGTARLFGFKLLNDEAFFLPAKKGCSVLGLSSQRQTWYAVGIQMFQLLGGLDSGGERTKVF